MSTLNDLGLWIGSKLPYTKTDDGQAVSSASLPAARPYLSTEELDDEDSDDDDEESEDGPHAEDLLYRAQVSLRIWC